MEAQYNSGANALVELVEVEILADGILFLLDHHHVRWEWDQIAIKKFGAKYYNITHKEGPSILVLSSDLLKKKKASRGKKKGRVRSKT